MCMKKSNNCVRLLPLRRFLVGFKPVFSLLLALMIAGIAYSQGEPITGRVISAAGEPLQGATVSVKGTAVASTTNAEGYFTIAAPADAVLEISYVGYTSREVSLKGLNSFEFTLSPTPGSLSDVVVVGYTTQRRGNITGAVSNVNMEDLGPRRVADVAQLLQGNAPGVMVTQSTGAPGDAIDIKIRGVGTIGNNSPLFIIDGIPSREINFLKPGDIESMTILKDAAAAAIYGSRASAGVVVITTKKGRKGRTHVDINYFTGFQKVTNLPQMLNAKQYMDKMEESWNNSGFTGTNPYTADKNRTDLANTDWLKELFETGRTQSLQVAASGGNDKVQFLISGEYFGQNGVIVFNNDQFKRYDFRTNINASLTDRLNIGTNLQLSNTNQDAISSKGDAPGVIRHAFIRPPVIPVYKGVNDPTYSPEDPFTDLPFYVSPTSFQANKYEYSSNPVALAFFTNDKRRNYRAFGNVYAEYGFLPNKELKFRTNLGLSLNMIHNKGFYKNFGDDDGGGNEFDKGLGRKNRPNLLNEERGQETNIIWNNTLNYNKNFNRHSVGALVGTEYISNYASAISGSRQRYQYDWSTFQYLDYGNTGLGLWNGGSASEWTLFSVFGSVNYNYDNRYFVTGSLRGDASSRFAPGNQWGYFPSVSAGWRISQEAFMRDVTWLSDLKLRASTGKLGNQEIANYSYLTLLGSSAGGQYLVTRYGNPTLKWESTRQDNVGVDIGLVRNRIYITADYFKKTTYDILLPVGLPKLVGIVDPTIVNAGSVENKGFEFAINYRNNDNELKYNINFNMGTARNKVIKLHPNVPNLIGSVSRTEPGHPLNAFYGYQMTGIYQNQNEINTYLHGTPNPSEKPGDIKFADLDGNGVIDDKDRTFIGDPNPRMNYGSNIRLEYKNLDFSMFFQGVRGVDKYNDLKRIIDYDTRPFNHSVATLDAWHGEGTSNTRPRSTFSDNGSSRFSSIYIEDASYFRLKNLELGYSMASLFNKNHTRLQAARIYFSAQNVFTITQYTGLDPESVDMIDMGTYPQARQFILGINLKL